MYVQKQYIKDLRITNIATNVEQYTAVVNKLSAQKWRARITMNYEIFDENGVSFKESGKYETFFVTARIIRVFFGTIYILS